MAVRPDGPHPARKGVDRRRDAVHRVRGHIAHPVCLGEDTRQHPQQVVHLKGARVVGAHQRVRGVQAAVQDLGLRVLGCHLQAGRPHPDAGGEHHIRIVVGHFFQDLFRIHLRGHVFPVGDDEPVAKFRLEGLDAFSWPRTQALVLALYSCRKTTLSWLGFWLKMFSLLSSGSLAEFGSSESVTA